MLSAKEVELLLYTGKHLDIWRIDRGGSYSAALHAASLGRRRTIGSVAYLPVLRHSSDFALRRLHAPLLPLQARRLHFYPHPSPLRLRVLHVSDSANCRR